MSQNPPFVPPWHYVQTYPMQPMYLDEHGRVRFVANRIVQEVLNNSSRHGYDLNAIAMTEMFTDAERMQFAQLIGYSVSGWGTLSYVSEEAYKLAQEEADKLIHEYK